MYVGELKVAITNTCSNMR